MTNYKYLFFDVANTLIYKPLLVSKICTTLKQFAIDIDSTLLFERHKLLSEIISFPAKTSQEFYNYFNAELLLALGIIPNSELVTAIFKNCSYLEWAKFDDTDILDKVTIPIGIISNWDTTLAVKLTSFFRVNFCKVVVSAETGFSKPDSALYEYALDSLDCKPDEILYIGDSIKLDIMPATALGMTAILIDRDNMYPNFKGRRMKTLYDLANYFPYMEGI